MFSNLALFISSSSQAFKIAQVEVSPPVFILENFSSPQFLIAVLSGLMMAFAFQLLLTNFCVAAIASPSTVSDVDQDPPEDLMSSLRGIETKIGIGALTTVTIALFIACFLAVKLSLVTSIFGGVIVGIVIWSTYFSIVVWLGSNAVGSLLGSIINTATSGLQGLMGTATDVLGANVAKNQAVSTAEDITAAVRRELTSGLDTSALQKKLKSSVSSLQLPKVDLDDISNQFQKFIQESDLKDLQDSDFLRNINRQTFIDLISSRTDFSKQDVNQIADRLEDIWKQSFEKGSANNSQSKLSDLLKSATPQDLDSNDFTKKLEQLVKQNSSKASSTNGTIERLLQVGLSSILGKVLQNTEFSDLDVQKVADRVNQVKASILGSAQQSGSLSSNSLNKPFSVIQADLENYLLFSPLWELSPARVTREFETVVSDPEADPINMRQELEHLDRNYFADTLSLRDDLRSETVQALANQLEEARVNVLKSDSKADGTYELPNPQETAQAFKHEVEEYLRKTDKEELNPEGIERDLQTLFSDPQAGTTALKERISQFDRDTLVQLLSQRQDLDEHQVNQTIDQIEDVKHKILQAPQNAAAQAKSQYEQTTAAIADYLRNTNLEELNPEGIQNDLAKLFEDPKAGTNALKERLGQVDRETLVKLLTQKGDLTEEQVNQAVDKVQSAIQSIVKAPRRLALRVQKKAVDFESNLESYLHNTNKEELNPEGIKRDLQLLLSHPQAGLQSLGDRVSQFDRSTFVALLSQREDMSEEEANRIADQVEANYRVLTEQLQKMQQTVQSAIDNLFGKLREYLNSLERPELNYEGIQEDFTKLFDDPQAGLEAIGDRLSHFNRDTLVAVLSSREDISEADANQLIEKMEETRDSLMERTQQIKQEVQKRYAIVKEKATQQAIETQKIAAGAAWWLFGTALTSLVASAIAGLIAVDGLGVFQTIWF